MRRWIGLAFLRVAFLLLWDLAIEISIKLKREATDAETADIRDQIGRFI